MENKPSWLPDLVNFNGNWDQFLQAIYDIFKSDFIKRQPLFRGVPVKILISKLSEGKEETFWHLISEGKTEENRDTDLERCKRIRWPKAIIVKSDAEKIIQIWETNRGRDRRVLIRLIFTDNDYLVVLIPRKGKIYLLTAYLITWPHHKENLRREYEAFKANAAL